MNDEDCSKCLLLVVKATFQVPNLLTHITILLGHATDLLGEVLDLLGITNKAAPLLRNGALCAML
jgi:hypothetical protein